MLTNWKTISNSINRLREVEDILNTDKINGYTKKEQLMMTREREKLLSSIGGIKDMGGQPDALFIIDVTKDDIAVKEANKLGIPVIAVLDTNASPDGITHPVPGNDDALRAIELYCDLMADAIIDGLQAELGRSGVDTGAAVTVSVDIPSVAAEQDGEAQKLQAIA